MFMKNSLKKYIFGIFILIGILFIPSGVRAADLKLTYDKKLDGCFSVNFVMPSYDNNGNVDGFLYFSDYRVIKQNLNNKIVYDIDDYEANADVTVIDETNTEGYKVKGETDLLIKIYDDNDELLFTKQFGGNGIEVENGTVNSYNDNSELDGYLVSFITLSSDLGIENGLSMAKLDLKGNVLWIKSINKYLKSDVGLLYADNDQMFAFESNDKSILKVNLFTNEYVFEKDTGIYISNINYSYNKEGVIDGVVVAGIVGNNYGTLIKYDLEGNEVFRVKHDNSNVYSMYYDVISSYIPDGSYDGYIVTAVTSDNKTLLIKYDLNGKKVFEKVYSRKNSFGFRKIDNYDSTGRQNGYLLYALNKDVRGRWDKREVEIQTYKTACDETIVAKYTYDMFPVAKEENNGGTITVKSDALPGELVKVNVLVKEGYSLARIIVKDENGKEIEVNSDGTFVMPEGKVTVSAIYKRVTNPDTVSAAYMVLGVILIASVGSMIVIKKRNDM